MKPHYRKPLNRTALVGVLVLVALLVATGAAWAQTEPEPVPFECTGEAFTVRFDPVLLYSIDQSATPFDFSPPLGQPITGLPDGFTQMNNLGYRSTDNLLYAVALNDTASPTGGVRNAGIYKIDSNGVAFPVATNPALPDNYRFVAGDVSPDGNWMYINLQVTSNASVGARTLYIVDLTTLVLTLQSKDFSLTGIVNVADWAASPTIKSSDGNQPMLYGASYNGRIYQMDPANGEITYVGAAGDAVPIGAAGDPLDAYGGAWMDADGYFFAYRNRGEIYKVDLSGPTLLNANVGGPTSNFNDAAACAAEPEPEPDNPAIDIEKTVFDTEDGSAPGGDIFEGMLGDLITYVFTVSNTGNVPVTLSTFDDTVLLDSDSNPIDGSDLTPALGGQTLQPGESLEFYYETSIDSMAEPWSNAQGSLLNEACVEGIFEQTTVDDCDDAAVLVPELCEDPGDPSDGYGCTPGYWKAKKHHINWPAPYSPSDDFDYVFGLTEGTTGDLTLLQALKIRDPMGEGALKRHAVAALLNAASEYVDYEFTVAEVIDEVQEAYTEFTDTGDYYEFEKAKDHLEMENERMCPLSNDTFN